MDITNVSIETSVLHFDVVIPHDGFFPYAATAAARISEEYDFEGFRRGKAPYEIVKKEVGEARIYERGADLAIRALYPAALEKALAAASGSSRTPIGSPEITVTKLAPGNELCFKVRVSLLPVATLPDYAAIARSIIKKEKKEISVPDADVDRAIEWLRDSRATETTVDRAAKNGDAVEIDFSLARGKTPIEGGVSKNHPLVIGKGKFLPGFEEALIGMRAGEEKSFPLAVPETWHDPAIRGSTLEVSVSLRSVRERAVPEFTDEFAEGLGAFKTKDELVQSVREGLREEREEKERERIRARIAEEIATAAVIDIPPLLIDAELGKMLAELKAGMAQMGISWDDYLRNAAKTEEDLRADWRTDAEKRVRIALVIREIADREGIAPTEEEIAARANEFLMRYKTPKDAERNIDPNTLRDYTIGVLRNEKVFEFFEQGLDGRKGPSHS